MAIEILQPYPGLLSGLAFSFPCPLNVTLLYQQSVQAGSLLSSAAYTGWAPREMS